MRLAEKETNFNMCGRGLHTQWCLETNVSRMDTGGRSQRGRIFYGPKLS